MEYLYCHCEESAARRSNPVFIEIFKMDCFVGRCPPRNDEVKQYPSLNDAAKPHPLCNDRLELHQNHKRQGFQKNQKILKNPKILKNQKILLLSIQIFSMMIVSFFLSICYAQTLPLQHIKLPPGFHIQIYARVPDARSLALGPDGIVFVGSRQAGKVYAVIPNKDATAAKKVITLASNLRQPNGVAYSQNTLYVATVGKILRFPKIKEQLFSEKFLSKASPTFDVIYSKLPTHPHHGWRYIRISPDNQWLYIGIGAPCNVCIRESPFASISRIQLNGKNFQVYAKGVRNSVGFDWDPVTKEFWFTDNGRDWLGDDIPPDELNHAPKQGMDFGFPYYWGDNQADPQFGKKRSSAGMTSPALTLKAHVAALGMRFYTGHLFPADYYDQLFIAEHGSWNRRQKIGYRIMLVAMKKHKPIHASVFASGWLQGERFWGRPVDLLNLSDGSLLVSDDHAGVLYRITYRKPNTDAIPISRITKK